MKFPSSFFNSVVLRGPSASSMLSWCASTRCFSRATVFSPRSPINTSTQDFCVDGRRRLVINNGAAGLPNFKDSTFGLLTRISSRPEVPSESLYGTTLDGVRFDALPIPYDMAAWLKRFLANWPVESPAHEGYFERIAQGPDFSIERAIRLARTIVA